MIHEAIKLLGLRAHDRVTGVEGVISTVAFDLYGCLQCILTPAKDKDGKMRDSNWFDIHRLEVLKGKRVMPVPDFDAAGDVPAEWNHGPAEKPIR